MCVWLITGEAAVCSASLCCQFNLAAASDRKWWLDSKRMMTMKSLMAMMTIATSDHNWWLDSKRRGRITKAKHI